MDLLQDDISKQENKSKKMKNNLIVISVLIVALIIVAIVLVFYMKNVQANLFKVIVDGTSSSTLSSNSNNEFIIENGKIYTSIRDICSVLGYSYYNGEYNKFKGACYICVRT